MRLERGTCATIVVRVLQRLLRMSFMCATSLLRVSYDCSKGDRSTYSVVRVCNEFATSLLRVCYVELQNNCFFFIYSRDECHFAASN